MHMSPQATQRPAREIRQERGARQDQRQRDLQRAQARAAKRSH
jgi:hypothetical protein